MPIILTRHNKRTRLTDILIVLEAESMARLKECDPFELDAQGIADYHNPGSRVGRIGVVSGSDDDIAEVIRLHRAGKQTEAMAHATRGFSTREGDDVYLTIGPAGDPS